MSKYPELYVLRHGQTEWNVEGRHQGRLDLPLTEHGRRQARAMGSILARETIEQDAFTAFCSPQGRAGAGTADLALEGMGLTANRDDRLVEVGFGAWEGLIFDEIAQRWPERAALAEVEPFGWHFQAPGGELLDALRGRCRAFLDALQGPAIIVTHGITSRALRGEWLGLDEYGMGELPGGQGVVHHLSAHHGHRVLES